MLLQRALLTRAADGGEGSPPPVEEPLYDELASAIKRTRAEVTGAFGGLRGTWEAVVAGGTPTTAQERDLDAAIEAFMEHMAGAPRDLAAFVSPASEGALIQQMNFMGWRVGDERARGLVGSDGATLLTEAIRERLSTDAFARLTEDGRLRFEDRLGEIKQAMLDGFARGDSVDQITRALAGDLDGYERGRLELIVKTEIGLASESGIRDRFREDGISRVEVIGDPPVPDECTDHIGQVYSVDDEDNLPLFHPGCACSIVPAAE